MWIRLPSTCCPSAPEAGDSKEASIWRSQMLEQFASLSTKHLPAKSWLRAWKTKFWMRHLFSRIYDDLTAARGVEKWISSLPDTRASRFRSPESARAKKTHDTSGQRSDASSPNANLPWYSLKMSQDTLFRDSDRSYKISSLSATDWSRMTEFLRSDYSQRKRSAPPTNGNGSSSSRSEDAMWRTPAVQEAGISVDRLDGELGSRMYDKHTGRNAQYGIAQQAAMQVWPTPACPSPHDSEHSVTQGMQNQANLARAAISGQWPTPTTRPDAPNKNSNTVNGPTSLGEAATKNWPTPSAGGSAGETSEVRKTVENWSTPTAHDGRRPGADLHSTQGGNLSRQAADLCGTKIQEPVQKKRRKSKDPADQAMLWPTPSARDSKGANSELHCTETGTGRRHMDQLPNFVAHSPLVQEIVPPGSESCPSDPTSPQRWQTPRVGPHGPPGEDSRHGGQPRGMMLNPAFVEWMMNWPIRHTCVCRHASARG